MNETTHPTRLWYGSTAAVGAWVVHGLTSFVISSAACTSGLPLGTLETLLIAITIAMLLVALSGGVISFGTWRAASSAPFRESEAWGRIEFMAMSGVFMSAIFSIAIIWGGLAPLITGLCEAGR